VQIMAQRGLWSPLNPKLILNGIHDVKTDLPHGHSLLFGLPFIAEIITSMTKSYRGVWERFGNPSYFINWLPPKEGFADPQGTKSQGFVNGMRNLWDTAMQNRANGDVQDLVYAGDWKVTIVGAEGEALEFTVPYRELTLQALSKTGVPPFLVGLHDATTETLSTTQAGLLSANVKRLRGSVQPQLEYAIRLRQRLAGKPDQFKLGWESPTLVDLFEHARADLFEAQAEAQAIRNDQDIWRLGALKPLEFARRHRPDLEGKSDEELAAWLPDLVPTPPGCAARTGPRRPRRQPDGRGRPGERGRPGGAIPHLWAREVHERAALMPGAKADAAAGSDAGTFTFMALFKRLLQKFTTQFPAALGGTTAANSFAVTLASDGTYATLAGGVTEAAPATDTASSGLERPSPADRSTPDVADCPAPVGARQRAAGRERGGHGHPGERRP
jgi:hypothetical protein